MSTAHVILFDHGKQALPLDMVRMADAMITDPPYSADVHDNAVSCSSVKGATKRELGFDHLDASGRHRLESWAGAVRRWSVIFSDVESSGRLLLQCENPELAWTQDGGRIKGPRRYAEYIRTIPWVRWSMPQLSGDRPTQGFEHLVVMHSRVTTGKKHWNGKGSLTAFVEELADGSEALPRLDHRCLRGEDKHKAEKPLDLCLDLVSWFSDPGETVFDPYAGSGAIGYACLLLGRHYVGLERDPKWVDYANHRFASAPIARDVVRIRRWLDAIDDEQTTKVAALRKARREVDKARVREWLEAA